MGEINSIICDIEGTTTSISFIKDTLFKYAYENCESYLQENYDLEEIQRIMKDLCIEAKSDDFEIKPIESKNTYILSISKYIRKLIDEDRKVGCLKLLQGKIWKNAFENKMLLGHVYEDVSRNFKKWTENGIKIYIYSSGSIEAQKLLFKYSENGDLTTYLTDYFDTSIGHKQEVTSYENILKHIKEDGTNVLFLSDIPNELYAAQKASMRIILLNRPNNYPITENDKALLTIVNNFDQINV